MESDEKLIDKFLTDKMHITVDDCEKLLVSKGWEKRKGKGNHMVYHKKGDRPIIIVVPKNTKYVKPGYVRLIVNTLHLED